MTIKQKGVLKSLLTGMFLSIAMIVIGSFCNILTINTTNISSKLAIAFTALLLPGIFLVISVGRLAKHRFFTPDDIDGGGLTVGTEKAKSLQAIIQNTLEQFCIAMIAYTGWAVIMPNDSLSVIVYASIAFSIGRILFFIGYNNGAPARALGFTLTFYPSVIMIITISIYLIKTFFDKRLNEGNSLNLNSHIFWQSCNFNTRTSRIVTIKERLINIIYNSKFCHVFYKDSRFYNLIKT